MYVTATETLFKDVWRENHEVDFAFVLSVYIKKVLMLGMNNSITGKTVST